MGKRNQYILKSLCLERCQQSLWHQKLFDLVSNRRLKVSWNTAWSFSCTESPKTTGASRNVHIWSFLRIPSYVWKEDFLQIIMMHSCTVTFLKPNCWGFVCRRVCVFAINMSLQPREACKINLNSFVAETRLYCARCRKCPGPNNETRAPLFTPPLSFVAFLF